jgi:glycoside/pentoside/hexuronide:cation symporter, GPH family
MTDHEGKVPLGRKLAYASPAFALAIVGIPVYVYIPKFYTDTVGIDIAYLGLILFSVRIFDGVTDPLFGRWSDLTRTRFGRRRPYVAAGSVFVAVFMFMLFNPPQGGTALTAIWFGVGIYALFLFWTAVTVPYESLGPEITFDYNERTSLFAIRDGALIAGTLAAAASPALVRGVFSIPEDPAGERSVFFWISVIYAPLIIGTCAWCAYAVREVQGRPHPTAKTSLLSDLRNTTQNRPFMILLAAYTISAIGNNLPATLILYYVEYVLLSSHAEVFLMLYFVTGILFLPGWIRIARRVGKKNAWLASMAINTGAFVGVFFLGPGDVWIYGVLVCLSGVGFGATLALPSSIQADVIDYDELLTCQRREGQYVGLWNISKKLAAAVGVGAGLAVLGWAGYQPNVEQSPRVVLTLKVLYAGVPSVFNLIAFVIALAYPIDGRIHGKIREAVASRKSGVSARDPLRPDRLLNGRVCEQEATT